MPTSAELTPLPKGNIKIGEELEFPVYDRDGNLLLAAGQSLQSQKQLDELAKKGLFHNPLWKKANYAITKERPTIAPDSPARSGPKKPAAAPDPSETGTMMKMSVEGSDESFVVRLVGTLGKEAFIVSHPMRDSSYVFVKEGQIWEFRAFYGTSVYRFIAQIQKVYLTPMPMVLVSWPLETHHESKLIRAARRVNCVLPTSMRRLKDGVREAFLNGMIENLSTGGAEFTSNHPARIQKGEEVLLAFQVMLGDRKFVLEPKAKVMSVTGEPGVGEIRCGLAFMELSDKDFAIIHAFVSEKLIQRLESPLYAKS